MSVLGKKVGLTCKRFERDGYFERYKRYGWFDVMDVLSKIGDMARTA